CGVRGLPDADRRPGRGLAHGTATVRDGAVDRLPDRRRSAAARRCAARGSRRPRGARGDRRSEHRYCCARSAGRAAQCDHRLTTTAGAAQPSTRNSSTARTTTAAAASTAGSGFDGASGTGTVSGSVAPASPLAALHPPAVSHPAVLDDTSLPARSVLLVRSADGVDDGAASSVCSLASLWLVWPWLSFAGVLAPEVDTRAPAIGAVESNGTSGRLPWSAAAASADRDTPSSAAPTTIGAAASTGV